MSALYDRTNQELRLKLDESHEIVALYRSSAVRDKITIAKLVDAGRAVVDRWDSQKWKDQPHTGEFIARLRVAVEKAEAGDA